MPPSLPSTSKKRIVRNKDYKIRQIKQITKELIEKNGYLATTNHGIARAAQISVGLLYKYFRRGKPDILKSLLEDEQMDFGSISNTFMSTTKFTPQQVRMIMSQLLTIFMRRHREKKAYVMALEIAMLSDPETFADMRGYAQENITIIPFIEQLNALGFLDRPLSREIIIVNTNVIDQITHQYVFFGKLPFPDDSAFVEYLTDLTIKIFGIKISPLNK